jgi:hypothetical protein
VWVTTCKRGPFGFQPAIERELGLLRSPCACDDCGERDDASPGLTSPVEAVIVRPARQGVSLAVTTRKNSRILGPGKQLLSAEAVAELVALEAKRNSPENRAKIRLEELPPAE